MVAVLSDFEKRIAMLNEHLPLAEFRGGPMDGYRIGMTEADLNAGYACHANGKRQVYQRKGKTWILEYKGVK